MYVNTYFVQPFISIIVYGLKWWNFYLLSNKLQDTVNVYLRALPFVLVSCGNPPLSATNILNSKFMALFPNFQRRKQSSENTSWRKNCHSMFFGSNFFMNEKNFSSFFILYFLISYSAFLRGMIQVFLTFILNLFISQMSKQNWHLPPFEKALFLPIWWRDDYCVGVHFSWWPMMD